MIQVVFYILKMTNEIQVFLLCRKIAFFGNLNLIPCTITPTQGSDGKFFMFFGTIPLEVIFCGPAPVVSITPAAI
jgi:hypothetical protein